MALIGIDIGTTFIKGAVLDPDSLALEHTRRIPFPEALPGLPPLYREYDPQVILAAVRRLLDELLPLAGACEGLVMSSLMHCLVLTTPDGQPRSNVTTWQDQRVMMAHPSGAGTYFDVLAGRISPADRRRLGNELRAGQPLGLLFWLAEQGKLPAQDLTLASLPDFIIANLCGVPAVTESTHAMSHGVLNLETMDWHHGLLADLGLDGLGWPEIRPHGAVAGRFSYQGRPIPCFTPVGDYQCSLAGALLDYGELSLNISTGSQVSLLRPRAEFGNFQTRPFFDGRFLINITHIPAGRSLNLLLRLLSELADAHHVELPDPWPYITQAAAAVENKELRVDLAFFNSSCGDHGSITAVREEELTAGHLFRAAFENMTENYYASALRLSPAQEWRNLVFSGGLAQKIPVLRELICAKFQAEYRLCPTQEDSLLGLLALGMVFSGRQPTLEAAARVLRAHFAQGFARG
jgi:sugar (pentulose or hexulose) kinase